MIKITLFRTLFFLGCAGELRTRGIPEAPVRSKHYKNKERVVSAIHGQPF